MAVVHMRRARRFGSFGAVRGDIDPATGKVFDGAVWQTPNDGESQTLSDAYKSYMNDPFVTMTEREKALYAAGQGATDLAYFSPPMTAGQYDANAASANAAAIANARVTNAAEIAALTATVQGAQAADLTQRNTAVYAANAAALEADAQRALASIIAAGGVFADTIRPGGYTSGFLTGMLTTDQWIEDYIALANGGVAANSNLMKGRLPKLPAGVYVAGSGAGSGQSLTSPSTGASMLPPPAFGLPGINAPTGGGAFADANTGSAGGNFLPSSLNLMPGGSATDGGSFGAPGGLSFTSPVVLAGAGLLAFLFLKRKRA